MIEHDMCVICFIVENVFDDFMVLFLGAFQRPSLVLVAAAGEGAACCCCCCCCCCPCCSIASISSCRLTRAYLHPNNQVKRDVLFHIFGSKTSFVMALRTRAHEGEILHLVIRMRGECDVVGSEADDDGHSGAVHALDDDDGRALGRTHTRASRSSL